MSKTDENLVKAFAGESQANRKYLAFSKRAQEDGFPNTSKLFRAIAEAETVHALNHLRLMSVVKTTKENIETAIKGETYEFTEMYPGFIATSNQEKVGAATSSFNFANQVEKIHEKLFEKALGAAEQKKDIETKDFFVCQVCGYTSEGEAPGICPVCGSPRERFNKIL
jgi:rubrerythrin